MKNLFSKFFLVGAVVAFTMTSCDKDDEIIANEDLPAIAKSFVSENFAGSKITSSKKDREGKSSFEYEVRLDNGVDIKFDQNGQWLDVEARNDREALPNTAFILSGIVKYVADNYTSVGINGIEREVHGFDVELTNDVDLEFNAEGNFIRIDR